MIWAVWGQRQRSTEKLRGKREKNTLSEKLSSEKMRVEREKGKMEIIKKRKSKWGGEDSNQCRYLAQRSTLSSPALHSQSDGWNLVWSSLTLIHTYSFCGITACSLPVVVPRHESIQSVFFSQAWASRWLSNWGHYLNLTGFDNVGGGEWYDSYIWYLKCK